MNPYQTVILPPAITAMPAVSSISFAAMLVLLIAATLSDPTDRLNDITDEAYLTQDLWNDGQAEIAFYRVDRTENQYGESEDQSFLVGTYLVKHDFDPDAMAKARPEATETVSTFKSALFYEFESGSYEYKRNWVVNSRQSDLRPMKASFSSFDWCSNIYRELAFSLSGRVQALMRSDDYGNSGDTFDYQAAAFPVHALPTLVRGLDFSESNELIFRIVTQEGRYVDARARLEGHESYSWPGGTSDGASEAERIEIEYESEAPSMIGEQSDAGEIWWRGTDDARLLLGMESGTGRYRMTLVEQLRSPYWDENLWPRLKRVSERP